MEPSLVSKVLDASIQALLGNDAPWVISYGENDERLWTLDDPALLRELKDRADKGIVLIWDSGAPRYTYSGNINTAEYLNPLAWSLCAASKVPSLRVTVLDCASAAHKKLRLYRAFSALDSAYRPFRLLTDPNDAVSALLDRRPRDAQSQPSQDSRDMLSQTVRSMLTERGQESSHHALANIVGPLILLGDAAGPHDALRHLFLEFGLIQAAPNGESAAPEPAAAIFPSPVRLLLVDDQADQGWERWVKKMASRDGQCSVEVRRSPEVLVEAVERWVSARGGDTDCRFALDFPPDTPFSDASRNTETVLLLDLRLFAMVPAADEAKFIEKLLTLCRVFQEDGAPGGPGGARRFAWPGFSLAELDAATLWCKNPVRETDAHHRVLTLLPRLISLVDLSIPIVIFSSTGQRRIIELLGPYGNIITDFEKPRFSGLDTAELVKSTEARLLESLRKANDILVARRKCSLIQSFEFSPPPFELRSDSPVSLPSRVRYVELFLDEVGANAEFLFGVGGCFAVFEAADFKNALVKADRFDRFLVRSGVRYFDRLGVGEETADGSKRNKHCNLMPFLANWKGNPDAPAEFGAVRVRIPRGAGGAVERLLFDPLKADNRFLLALNALLELFLCESLPALAGLESPVETTVSVFAGTRPVFIIPQDQDEAMLRFGLKKHLSLKNMFDSFGSHQVYPIVANILDSHRAAHLTYRLSAVALPYHDNKDGAIKEPRNFYCRRCGKVASGAYELKAGCRCGSKSDWQPDYRALHYLADELLTEFPGDKAKCNYDALLATHLSVGEFDEIRDEVLMGTLAAGRSLDVNDVVSAVCGLQLAAATEVGKKPRAGYWLQGRIAARLPHLSGGEFLQIVDRLRGQP